jgi:DNA-binding response OmpR family regulator
MPARILLVDNYAPTADMLEEVLSEEGYRITRHEGIPPAAMLAQTRPDLIILDYQLDRQISSLSLLQDLCPTDPDCRVPLILCTTTRQETGAAGAWLAAHGVRVLHKPFDLTELLDAVETALAHASL